MAAVNDVDSKDDGIRQQRWFYSFLNWTNLERLNIASVRTGVSEPLLALVR
jgi:hypothetical protein